MRVLNLKRVSTNEHGTWGVLIEGEQPFAVTLENPWINNEPNISCIPDGEYLCNRVNSPRFGDTFEIMDVVGRTHILFHKGNTEDDTRGCVLVGERFDYLEGKPAILQSSVGFYEFMESLADETQFMIEIEWVI